jgi:hypothetical protein
MTAKNNDVLYNAAVLGIIAGATVGSSPVSGASYATLVANAEAVALQIDTAIATDATITGAAGVPAIPTTAALQGNQLAKSGLMFQLCASVWAGKNVQGVVPAVEITALVAYYTAAIAAIQVT